MTLFHMTLFSLTHSFTHSITQSLTHSLTHSIFHRPATSTRSKGSLTDSCSVDRIQGIKFSDTQLILFTRNNHKTSSSEEETDLSQLLSMWCWRRTVRGLPKLRQLKFNSKIVDFKCLLPQGTCTVEPLLDYTHHPSIMDTY